MDVVAYGRPATAALAARIAAAKAGHPLDAVTVIVSSNQAGLSARRILGAGALGAPGLANVGFVTPLRLAELLGSSVLGRRRPLTNPVLAAGARSVLATAPGMFRDVADHHATQAALVTLYAELSRMHPATLAAIAAGSARGAEVVRLVAALAERLAAYDDEDDLAVAAARRLADDPAAASSLGSVIWHLPDRLSLAMQELVRAVIEGTHHVAVIVGLTGADDADAAVRDTCANAGVLLPDAPPPPEARAERLISTSDPDEEVRAVIREIVSAARSGTPLDRIGVFFPLPEPYARTLHEQLAAAGIPHNGPPTTRLADSVAGRTLLGALTLPGRGWRRADVVALLAGAPLRHEGRHAPTGRWDSLSRDAGVVGGLTDWRSKLAAHAASLHAERDRLAADGSAPEARLHRLADGASTTLVLARFLDGLATHLDGLEVATSWADRSDAARALLADLLGPEHDRQGWPDHEVDAAVRVDAALARLVVLDEIEPEPSLGTFEQAVLAELDVKSGRIGRFGDGVLVAPLAAALGLDLDVVIVVGMVEGTCPSFRRDDALLPDADRSLAPRSGLLTRQQRLGDQHRAFLAALAAGGGQRTLVLPRGDLRDRRSRLASRWLLDSLGHRLGRRVFSSEVADLGPDELHVVASYADGVERASDHASVVDRDVAALLRHTGAPGDHPLATGDLGRGYTCQAARSSAAFTEWDGNLGGQTLPSPAAGTPASPSRLETWAACPFRYFLAHVLRLDERDDPEEIVAIGSLDLGRLIHTVLERFLGEVLQREAGPPAPAEPWTNADRARIAAIAGEVFTAYEDAGLTGRPLLWRRTQAQVLDDLDAFLTADDAHRASGGLTPVQVEMPFGLRGEAPLTLQLADGRELTFRGYADRVDEGADGRLVVLDYKTGKDRYEKKLDADPVQEGRTLQLGVYAEAASARLGGTGVDARYWLASADGRFAQRGYPWDDGRRTRFLDVVGTIVDGIESGTFPGRPGAFDTFFGSHENCGFCPFDRVCPRDRDDHEQTKRDAPELSLLDRLALVEPADEATT